MLRCGQVTVGAAWADLIQNHGKNKKMQYEPMFSEDTVGETALLRFTNDKDAELLCKAVDVVQSNLLNVFGIRMGHTDALESFVYK